MRVPRLHLIGPLGNVSEPEDYLRVVRAVSTKGLIAIHVRLPGGHGGDVLRLTREVIASVDDQVLVVVNDRVDAAMIAGAPAVHLGERSVHVGEARRLVGPETLIGRSVHSFDGANAAEEAGADYLMAGHIYDTESKAGQPGRGLDWLRDICRSVSLPVIAIGGITAERVPEVMQSGAWGVAVGREVLEATNPDVATARLLDTIEQSEAT